MTHCHPYSQHGITSILPTTTIFYFVKIHFYHLQWSDCSGFICKNTFLPFAMIWLLWLPSSVAILLRSMEIALVVARCVSVLMCLCNVTPCTISMLLHRCHHPLMCPRCRCCAVSFHKASTNSKPLCYIWEKSWSQSRPLVMAIVHGRPQSPSLLSALKERLWFVQVIAKLRQFTGSCRQACD
jgi:hypothetical protein